MEKPSLLLSLRRRLLMPATIHSLPGQAQPGNIFVWPLTSIGATLLALVIGSIGLSGMYESTASNGMAVTIASMVCVLVVLAFWQSHKYLIGLRLVSVAASPAHAGDPITVVWTWQADRNERCALVARVDDQEVAWHLPANGQSRLSMDMPPRSRGFHDWPAIAIVSLRPYGLAEARCVWHPPGGVWIYPRVEAPCPPFPSDQAVASGPLPDDLPTDHRRYRVEDGVRQIDWKLSARQLRWWSRHAPTLSKKTDHLVLSWSHVEHMPTEQALSRLTAWIIQAQTHHRPYSLQLPHVVLGPSCSAAHHHACLRALAAYSS